jgi:hypothetical protein
VLPLPAAYRRAHADLRQAIAGEREQRIANEEHLARLRAGVEAWNIWRKEHPDFVPNLQGAHLNVENLGWADLHEARLDGANLGWTDLNKADLSWTNLKGARLGGGRFKEAYLKGATFKGADLTGANFEDANLTGADLFGADLKEARFEKADFLGANFERAHLIKADLRGAYLHGANLERAILSETVFADVDLNKIKGLEACKHFGPSVLDHRTLQRLGHLPLVFLRGCGLPDRLIDYLPSLLEEAIHFYSCFISYSSKDDAFVQRLHADLQNNGVRCWFASHDLPMGAKTWDAIDEAIRLRDKVLLILSKNAIASDWVEDEVTKGFAEERRRNQLVLFPVRIDDTVMKTGEA